MKKAVLWLCAAAVALVPIASSCGGVEAAAPGDQGGVAVQMPSQVLGLRVEPERVDVSQIQKVSRPYIDQIAVFSMRETTKLLRATLEVARFNRAARPSDPKFRGSISGVLGGQKPVEIYVNKKLIDSSAATSQNIYSWFNGRGLFVLSVQQDYQFPRTLLRHVLDLDLKL